ncbi:methyltransferase domain-containing protein [Siccirubricoccus phaeus]|uniref:methyltransferase domain-containing protein n=1 Tax=Siccirubricoccus phaeus TaxID=2595053 RepID=UPI0011F2CE6B|nr:methyltransferase domain-containing protein [Siccirubricoccus phaeus]
MAARKAGELLREGAARHGRGELAAAEALYRQVLALDPGEPNAHNLMGVLARQRGAPEQALRHTERALARSPEAPVFLANHGAALAEAGRLAEAVAHLRAALARRPEDAVSLRNLGQALCALGDARAAAAPLEQAVRLDPGGAAPWLALAHARRELGEAAAALAAARAALARAGGDAALAGQARFLLAALGEGAAPDRAPAEYVRDLFDQFAPRFEAELTERLAYRTPEALAALVEAVAAPRGVVVLDLGCGTGLSGTALAPFAARLEGLDLSPRMLAEAGKRGLYAALHAADLVEFLPSRPGAYGLVAAVDVLNYLGDLAPALAGMAQALAPGGLAAFSVEAGAGAPFALGEGMRYRHDPVHVAGLAAAAGFTELARQEAVLRQEKGRPVAGVLFVLRRGAAGPTSPPP